MNEGLLHNGHISSEQLEQFSRQPDGSGELWSHIGNCSQCRTTLEKYRKLNAKLDKLVADGVRSKPTMNCPDERIWFDVAGGTLSPEESLHHAQHASTCDSCGKKLKAAMRIFEPELSQEEEQILDSLPSSREQLLGRVEEISRPMDAVAGVTPKKTVKRSFWRPLSYAFPAVAVIALSLFFLLPSWNDLSRVEHLMAQAYAENRTIEMRIPYAAHATIRQHRSGENGSLTNSSKFLRQATDKIASGMKSHPNDAKWLLLQARLDLLDWRYKAASATLSQIENNIDNHTVDSSDLWLTHALELYEQGESEHHSELLGQAVDLLGKILQKDPNDKIALFDRAIVCEKLDYYECAATDWQHLLKIEADKGWAEEARQHLDRLQEKKKL